jgi:putative transposase
VKYACITTHHPRFAVALMCRVLAVSRAGYYGWQGRQQAGTRTIRETRDAQQLRAIRAAYTASGATYGAPRIQAELTAQGTPIATKRIARLMRTAGLVARPRARRIQTTESGHGDPIAPNHLARRFAVDTVPGVNRVWVADITYVPTRAGFLYLAVVLDLASRRIVGWAMRPTLGRDLAIAALQAALADRRPPPGLVHHSDRGSQYASDEYRALLHAHQVTGSMSRKGDCYDNAVAESFFATLEHELFARQTWDTHEAARRAIFVYIVEWYNRARRHSTLGYVSPAQYEAATMVDQHAA